MDRYMTQPSCQVNIFNALPFLSRKHTVPPIAPNCSSCWTAGEIYESVPVRGVNLRSVARQQCRWYPGWTAVKGYRIFSSRDGNQYRQAATLSPGRCPIILIKSRALRRLQFVPTSGALFYGSLWKVISLQWVASQLKIRFSSYF